MAYDPQDPLSSIIEERKKRANSFTRNLKSQITGRTPKEPEIPEAIANQPTVARGFTPNPNARMAPNQTDAPASVPAGVGPGERQIRPRPTGGTFNIPTGRTAPYGLTQTANKEIVSSIDEAERAAGRKMPEMTGSVSTTPPARPPAAQPKPTPSIEDQRLINRLREGGLPESIYANTPNMLQQLKQGTMSPEYKNTVEQAARYNYNQTPAMQQAVQTTLPFQGRAGFGDVRMREQSPPPAEPGSSSGLMTRGVQQPGLGQVGVNAPTNIPSYLAGDRAAITAMERMRTQQSTMPQQPTQAPAQAPSAVQQPTTTQTPPAVQQPSARPAIPTMEQPEPAYYANQVDNYRAQIRQQIANEQQAMLKARRVRGGSYGDGGDATALERIAGMRQELAQFDQAAGLAAQGRVKSPEENLVGEQDLAKQASSILEQDASNLRESIRTMPEGFEKQSAMAKLQDIESRQQQMSSRASGEPGMIEDAYARTERQRSMIQRNREIGEIAMLEGERIRSKRVEGEQTKKQIEEATKQAALAQISRPEREFGLTKEKFDSEIRNINSMISSRDASSQLAQKRLEFDQSQEANRQAWMKSAFDYANDPNNPEFKKKVAEASKTTSEAAVIDFELKRRMRMAGEGMTPQEIEQKQIVENATLDRLGLRKQDGSGLMQSAIVEGSKLAAEFGIDGRSYVGSSFTGNAEGGVKAVMVLESFANGMEQLNKTNPELAKIMANEFLGSLPSSMGRNIEGTGSSFASKLSFGIPPLGIALAIAQVSNQNDKEFVARGFNKFRDTMTRLGGLESTQQGSFVGPPTNQ